MDPRETIRSWLDCLPSGLREWVRRPRRKRTPTILQMEMAECGAASLGMVLGYHGRHVPLDTLRYRCGVSRDGSNAMNVMMAARHFGMKVKGFKMEPRKLREMPLPAIAFWNFNHFVVVEGFGRNKVYLNDPALGPRSVGDAEFDEAFTGVVLVMEPGPTFEKGGEKPSAFKGIIRRLRSSPAAFLFVALASLGLVLPGVAAPSFSRIYTDFFLIEGLDAWLWPVVGAMIASALLTGALVWLQQHHLMLLRNKLATAWSGQFLWHVLKLPVPFFMQRAPAEIGGRIQLNELVAELVAGKLSTVSFNLVTVAVYAGILFFYDGLLAAIGLGTSLLSLGVFWLVARTLSDETQKLAKDRGELSGMVMQGLRMIETFKAGGTERQFFTRFAAQHAKVLDAEQHSERLRVLLNILPPFFAMLGATAVLVIGGLMVMDGALTIGMLVAFQGLLMNISAPIMGVIGVNADVQAAQGILNRLDDTLRQDQDPEFGRVALGEPPADRTRGSDPADTPFPVKLGGALAVSGLSFGYSPAEPPLIEGFDLSLRPGARVALVGGSGSGKSTIGKLLAGLYQPWAGQIAFGGHDIAAVPREVLRNTIAVVDQSPTLFEGTVAENITMWDPTIPEEAIIAAAKDAEIHDDIALRPGGYAFRLAEGGRNLSGGQRQRLEIARALVTNPSVLLLDEATSALDTSVEARIGANLRRRGCTAIIIAHRLSTIRDADEIVVLKEGKPIQRGTHADLIGEDGPYRLLVES